MSLREQPQRGTFDLFLSQLEDDLQKLRESGQPIRSLRQFSGCVQRSWSHASECARQGTPQKVTKVIRCEHGGHLVTMPEGLVKTDSENPNGDWEKFMVVDLDDGKVAIQSVHGRYLSVQEDGSVRADAETADAEVSRFEFAPHSSGSGAVLGTFDGNYLIAMPDGFLRADSPNPDGTWERFEISDLTKDLILNRKELFEFFDQLSMDGDHFTSLIYVVNQWNLGGVVRLKHHSCILVGGSRYLKFDFGRWGIGWTLSDEFPVLPKGTCLQEAFDIDAEPDLIKQYCLESKEFSWMSNNCSSFSSGLMRALQVTKPSKLPDPWPTWSHCLASPPVKVPGMPTPGLVARTVLPLPQDQLPEVPRERSRGANAGADAWCAGALKSVSREGLVDCGSYSHLDEPLTCRSTETDISYSSQLSLKNIISGDTSAASPCVLKVSTDRSPCRHEFRLGSNQTVISI